MHGVKTVEDLGRGCPQGVGVLVLLIDLLDIFEHFVDGIFDLSIFFVHPRGVLSVDQRLELRVERGVSVAKRSAA